MSEALEHSKRPAAAEALVLGIETSCDECAVAVVSGTPGQAAIRSDVIRSQVDLHAHFGGVVPEIAARAHADTIEAVAAAALAEAGVVLSDITAVAATIGPGLLGGLLVGATFGKAAAFGAGVPFVPVNHLEGHVLTPRLTHGIAFPYCVALLSGGHAQFVAVAGPGQYHRLGGTIDDAAGEAFDKTAKLLGLGYPGGPAVEEAARSGDPHRFDFPVPLQKRAGCDLSFSGLKTAVRLAAQKTAPLTDQDVADICAGFQFTVARLLEKKARRAMDAFAEVVEAAPSALVTVGGVAANGVIRAALERVATRAGAPFIAPPLALCTDNGAMIAYAAIETEAAGTALAPTARVRSRWPLDGEAAVLLGAGKRGAKG
ncbi:tRNA (adenosine(37)-N6)-threonylcarbamoyltransferase complex transferase subunit TsaD [Acuticoccus sp. MNP-M23]|uniref:tRNA (adenosine(37)-N6)-threonylcarbamoyltransferase complex transferase subunit TsaD n=1 Tax=Acuticoccus sp. MNP-M23 TaxID=3072793 RepID=UPI002815553C|nr:tRNA (adenosine(37)-N6)-threonylcarbamoyltransferase complex transferase subunit TsaD [Acuticoccus sp. MNP-M23]WMS41550.1 tRNA (adenosine(37)-N6)-threonylcarbamoyltransferase complex transferase subunit TsaD [Acuticoccus sp. MNP-M23]